VSMPTWEAGPVLRLTFAVKTAPRTAEQDQKEPHKLIQEPTSCGCGDTCTVGTNRFLFLFVCFPHWNSRSFFVGCDRNNCAMIRVLEPEFAWNLLRSLLTRTPTRIHSDLITMISAPILSALFFFFCKKSLVLKFGANLNYVWRSMGSSDLCSLL
jgi:hypothetical protein